MKIDERFLTLSERRWIVVNYLLDIILKGPVSKTKKGDRGCSIVRS